MQSITLAIDQGLKAHSRSLLVRGAAAVTFGAVLLAWPAPTVRALTIVFSVYALCDAAIATWSAIEADKGGRARHVLHAATSAITGLTAVTWPGITVLALLYLIGAWAIGHGVADVADAARQERHSAGRAGTAISGALSITFGTIMVLRPGAGAIALITLIAATAITAGVLCVARAFDLNRVRQAFEQDRALASV